MKPMLYKIHFFLVFSLIHQLNGVTPTTWQESIKEAQHTDLSKVRRLHAIKPGAKDVIWNFNKDRVLMTSLIPQWAIEKFYRPAFNKDKKFTPGVYMWVTIAPDLKNFIASYKKTKKPTDPSIQNRVQDRLGLPENSDNLFVVEMWVKPGDLFRPCADPEIEDVACLPDEDRDNQNYDVFSIVNTTPELQGWFKKEKQEKYTGTRPFPWTRLGYTYDEYNKEHGQDAQGESEYVIRPGSDILLQTIAPLDQYF